MSTSSRQHTILAAYTGVLCLVHARGPEIPPYLCFFPQGAWRLHLNSNIFDLPCCFLGPFSLIMSPCRVLPRKKSNFCWALSGGLSPSLALLLLQGSILTLRENQPAFWGRVSDPLPPSFVSGDQLSVPPAENLHAMCVGRVGALPFWYLTC